MQITVKRGENPSVDDVLAALANTMFYEDGTPWLVTHDIVEGLDKVFEPRGSDEEMGFDIDQLVVFASVAEHAGWDVHADDEDPSLFIERTSDPCGYLRVEVDSTKRNGFSAHRSEPDVTEDGAVIRLTDATNVADAVIGWLIRPAVDNAYERGVEAGLSGKF